MAMGRSRRRSSALVSPEPRQLTSDGGYGTSPRSARGVSTTEYTVLVVLMAVLVTVTTLVMWDHARPTCEVDEATLGAVASDVC